MLLQMITKKSKLLYQSSTLQHWPQLTMRWLSFFISAALWSIAHALSSSGSRLLVINEDVPEQEKYGQLWKDLRGALNCYIVVL